MRILEALDQAQANMTKADLALLNYIKDQGLNVCNAPISEIAQSCGVSHATVTRFARKFGYESLQAFKIALAQELGPQENLGHLFSVNISYEESSEVTVNKLSQLMVATIQRTAQNINHTGLQRVIKFLSRARRVYFIGKGNSGFVALDTAFKFNRIGLDCRALSETHERLMLCSLLTRRDVVVAFSNNGSTPEILKSAELAKEQRCKLIVVTAEKESKLSALADETLLYEVRETCLDSGSIYSKAAVYFIIDLVYTELCKVLGQRAIDTKHKTSEAISDFCDPAFFKRVFAKSVTAKKDQEIAYHELANKLSSDEDDDLDEFDDFDDESDVDKDYFDDDKSDDAHEATHKSHHKDLDSDLDEVEDDELDVSDDGDIIDKHGNHYQRYRFEDD